MRKYFGTDGIRGLANQELTPDLAYNLGKVLGYELNKWHNQKPVVLIGRDTRLSGELFENALVAGLLSVGADVMRLGVISTPGVAYLTKTNKASAGIMISASHNPFQDNGIKIFRPTGYKLTDEEELEIEKLLDGNEEMPKPTGDMIGRVENYFEGSQKYQLYLEKTVENKFTGLKIGLDCANGATYNLAPRLFANLDAEVFVMANNPDGININDGVGSTHPETLSKFVVENELDLGLAFDGDGDRLIAVDHKGEVVNGDHIMYVVAKFMKEKGTLANDTIVTTILSNYGFQKAIENLGINNAKTNVGDRYVLEEMLDKGYNFGGEQSGHLILLDYSTTGDGLLSGLQLVNVVLETKTSLHELANEFKDYPQVALNVRVTDKNEIMNHEEVIDITNKAKEELGDRGTIILRPSGTEPLIRVNVTAETNELASEFAEMIAEVINKLV